MTVDIGVIGVGMIGQDHIRRLTHVLSGGRVVAVTDVDRDRAETVAKELSGAAVYGTGRDLIADEGVDAVVVTSWGPTHEEYVLACIEAGKQVFCEKPLATTREACEHILDAEVAAGRRMVMVGFMRRYDDGYRAMKDVVRSGQIGAPLLFHSAHRNASVPPRYTSDMIINDTCVHDIDISRWLLDTEVAAVRVLRPRRNRYAAEHLTDPLIVLLEMADGTVVDVEAMTNAGYGYDIRGEIVGERGTVELSGSGPVVVKREGRYGGPVPVDWRDRFLRAYDIELQAWLDAVRAGRSTGPSAWDGYAATVVSDAALRALTGGDRVTVSLRDKPELYRSG